MKKFTTIIAATLCALSFLSCKKTEDTVENQFWLANEEGSTEYLGYYFDSKTKEVCIGYYINSAEEAEKMTKLTGTDVAVSDIVKMTGTEITYRIAYDEGTKNSGFITLIIPDSHAVAVQFELNGTLLKLINEDQVVNARTPEGWGFKISKVIDSEIPEGGL